MKKTKTILFLFILLILIPLFTISINVLVVECVQTHKLIYINTIKPDDEFTMRWMHSVELQPWEEIFKIDKDYNIVLDRTRFKQFGAGVPDYAGNKTEIEDGYIIFSGINKKMDKLPYGISSFAKHTFIFKDKEIKLYEKIKDADSINIYMSKISIANYIIKIMTASF